MADGGDNVLVVDDEPAIVELVTFHLEAEGFQVRSAADGIEAMMVVRSGWPDILVLDVMLPGRDGLTLCREIRRESTLPVILVTARSAEVDRVLGLELGADDYVTKPFSPRELAARVKAVLRRHRSPHPLPQGLVIDVERHLVTVDGRAVQLTSTEFRLLRALAARPGRVMSREELLERLWADEVPGESRTIDVHIRHIREKIEADPAHPRLLETVRGVGYRLKSGS